MMNEQATDRKSALAQLLDAICDAVAVGGEQGVAGGTLYAALMGQGCTLERYQMLMDLLVEMGRLKRNGQHYTAWKERTGR